MKSVYLITEDNHGGVGVAKDYPSAINFLVNEGWLDGSTEFYDMFGDTKTIVEDLGEEWKDVILSWDIETFNNYFDGCFFLILEEVYGAD